MIYKDLDRSTLYVKELFLREASFTGATKHSALEQMLNYGYCDGDLSFLCRYGYIDHSTYMQAIYAFNGKS